jgi:MFS family permease
VLQDAGFRRFWAAQVVSEAGSGVGAVALTAVLTLNASALDMGILSAALTLPVLLLALPVGVWVDRLPQRPLLVATNLGRGVLLAAVPLAAVAGWLQIELLWGIAFVVGALAVGFDIALTSFVPRLVARDQLVDANATLQASGAAARVAGPGAGGWLVQVIGAPFTVLVDAASFIAGAVLLTRVHVADDFGRPERPGMWTEIRVGLIAVWRDRLLRAMVVSTTIAALAGSVLQAVYVLFAVREIELSAPVLGTVFAIGSLAGVAGAAVAGRLARRLTPGGAMIAGQTGGLIGTGMLLAARPGVAGTLVLITAQVCAMAGLQIFSVTQISLRQAITPRHLLGRVNATRRFAVFGIQPVGALLGGALGTAVSLEVALGVATTIHVIALGTMLASPLRDASRVSAERALVG